MSPKIQVSPDTAVPTAAAIPTAPPTTAQSDRAGSDDSGRRQTNTERAEALLRAALRQDEITGQTVPPDDQPTLEDEAQLNPEQVTPSGDGEPSEQAAPADDAGTFDEADDDDTPPSERNAWPETARKRVGKLTGRLRGAERDLTGARERIAQLETELETARATTPTVPRSTGLESLTGPQIEAIADKAQSTLEMVEAFLDGATTDSEAEEVRGYMEKMHLSDEAALKRHRRELQRLVRDAIPSRREFLKTEAQHNARAVELFPYWKDRSHSDYQAAMRVVEALPALRQRPDWRLLASTYLKGLKAVRDEMAAATRKGNGAPAPAAIPPKPPTPVSSAIRVPSADVARQAARDTALTSRSAKSVQDWVKSELQAAGVP